MSEANKFFSGFKTGLKGELFTSAIAQIEVYDPKLNKADITILPGGELVKSVPVGIPQTDDFFIRMPYQKGDYVVVVFSKTDIDPIMFDNGKVPSERLLEIDDAIVVSGLNLYTNPLPATDLDKLVIGRKDGVSKITMDQIGNVAIETTKNVYLGGSDATEGVPLGVQLKTWLDNHTHPISWTDPGGSGTSGAPTSSSPAPSGKVKTK